MFRDYDIHLSNLREDKYGGGTLEERAARVPLGWFGQPEDAAPAFVFFACKDADYITGQVLAVDGGSTL